MLRLVASAFARSGRLNNSLKINGRRYINCYASGGMVAGVKDFATRGARKISTPKPFCAFS